MKAPFGWTVVRDMRAPVDSGRFKVYKRDCPADKEHFAADLAPFTHDTARQAREAGQRGEYAYKDMGCHTRV